MPDEIGFAEVTEMYPHCQFVARALGIGGSSPKRVLLHVGTLGGPDYSFAVERPDIDEAASVAAEAILFLERLLSGETEEETEWRLNDIRQHVE